MKSFKEWENKPTGASELLKKVEKQIHSIVPNADVILYGSQVRGEANRFSDWDFLILTDQLVDRNLTIKLRDSLYEIELETDAILSSIIRTKQDWNSPRYSVLPFKRIIEKEGVVL
jgi:predicted nucleotidyltransferase